MKTVLKNIIKYFIATYSTANSIESEKDIQKEKAWVKKVIKLYAIFSLIGLIIYSSLIKIINIVFPISVVLLILILLTAMGYSSMLLYFKKVIKTVLNAGKIGYKVGEQIKSEYVTVKHEYANTYKVSSHTDDKGILFAVIAAIVSFICWAFFCVYIAPFLTYKKVRNTFKNIREYESKKV